MKIVHELPPNYEAIMNVMKLRHRRDLLFCYGDTIFDPWHGPIREELIEHEKVHSTRQGNSPDAWWEKYLLNPRFRFDEELLAHQREYEVLSALQPGRNARRRSLHFIASRLKGPIYGGIGGPITKLKKLVKGQTP